MAFTGALSQPRRIVAGRVRRARAIVSNGVSSRTDIVIQGHASPAYKWGDIGVKLDRVDEQRRSGRLVYVINEEELERLLAGGALSRKVSDAAAGGKTSVAGVAHRPAQPSRGRAMGTGTLEIDLDERDRRLREHCQIIDDVAAAARWRGYEPLSPLSAECAYDLAWQLGKTLHVVEVKTTTSVSEVQQLRLGLGQVLEYRTTLSDQGWQVRAHLMVSRKPTSARAVAACVATGVDVWWVDALVRIFQ